MVWLTGLGRLGNKLCSVFPLWDGLLRRMAFHQSEFLTMLTAEMMILLISPSKLDIALDSYREALAMWLEWIYTNKGWVAAMKRGKLDDKVIMETCLRSPSHWTVRLAVALIGSSGHEMARGVYADRVNKAAEGLSFNSKTPIFRPISIENLDRLLPSQRGWLESEEGPVEKARYLKRVKTLDEQPEEPQHRGMKLASAASIRQHDSQSKTAGVIFEKKSEVMLDDGGEEGVETQGWSKWEGVWIAKPIGVV